MGIQFDKESGERIIRGIRTVEGVSAGRTAAKNLRHRRAENGSSANAKWVKARVINLDGVIAELKTEKVSGGEAPLTEASGTWFWDSEPWLQVFANDEATDLLPTPEEIAFGQLLSPGDTILLTYDVDADQYFYVNHYGKLARWVYGSFEVGPETQSQQVIITVEDFWEGYNPGSTVNGRFRVGSYCPDPYADQEMRGYARFNRRTNEYEIISTESAFLGPPSTIAVGQGKATPNYMSASQNCGSGAADDSLKFTRATQNILAFPCGDPGLQTDFTIDGSAFYAATCLCQYICTYCYPDNCEPPDPPKPNCDGDCCDCNITSVNNVEIDGNAQVGESLSLSGCSWEVTLDNGAIATVSYGCCGEWSVDLGGVRYIGTGGCGGALLMDESDGRLVGSVSADGVCCANSETQCDCCPDWTACMTVTDFNIGVTDTDISQKPNTDVEQNGCVFTVEFTGVETETSENPKTFDGVATITRTCPASGTPVWTVECDPPVTPFNGVELNFSVSPGTCIGIQRSTEDLAGSRTERFTIASAYCG